MRKLGLKALKVIMVRAAQMVPGQISTKMVNLSLPVRNHYIEPDPQQDINKLILVERHRASGKIIIGFIQGFGLRRGAIASSVAHDHHHLVALGIDDEDLALALKTLIDLDGGLVAVAGGKVLAYLSLPIGGLVSDLPLEIVVAKLEELNLAAKKLGNTLDSPFATLSLICLPVIPEVGFSDQGMIDVYKQKVVDIIVE
ncbi:adenine deaminase C-terminal domain-containing protein [Moorella naiadis]|uniref:adenine deaminase C-terminal domain-containing protein n=1 Tax=Moorella naiadis (nom. illeg.) TaxID=3093670 RepID=UPI003D9CB163